ncbi:MAG: hypothetical protein AB7S68_36330, partial [Polyangiaceae bacterium]
MGWRQTLLCGAFVSLASCAGPARSPQASDQCHYRVSLREGAGAILDVDARCTGPEISSFSVESPGTAPFVRAWQGDTLLKVRDRSYGLIHSGRDVRIRYEVDLGEMGDEYQDFDIALHQSDAAGAAVVSPASTWLLLPEPLPAGLPVRVSVSVPRGSTFRTGLTPHGARSASGAGDYALVAQEIPVATYSAFGGLQGVTLEFPPPISCNATGYPACEKGTLEVVSLPRLVQSPASLREL